MVFEHSGWIINGITIFNYYIEMLFAGIVVTASLKKRRRFVLRLSLTLLVYAVIWLFVIYQIRGTHFVLNYLRYFILFVSSLIALKICFDIDLSNMFFCGIAMYALQHCICKLYTLFFMIYALLNPTTTWMTVSHFVIYWSILLLAYIAMYFLLRKRLLIADSVFSMPSQLVTVILLLCITLIISSTYDLTSEEYLNSISFLLCDSLCAGLIVLVQYRAYGLAKKEREMIEAKNLHRLEVQQMKQTKEMMDIINLKTHDLKHQLLVSNRKLSESEATEIANAVYSYDDSVQTGSQALDLVVTQKKILCKRENITFTHMLNGELLSFLSDGCIYSLFGNIVDNAIEAVRTLPVEQRYIVLEVKETAGMIIIRSENEYNRPLHWNKAELQTSKGNKNDHGFGMKSISSIVHKYGGTLSIHAEHNVFILTITFPITTSDRHEE